MRTLRRLEAEIEALMARRLGRECVFVPSGRIALYCALRTLTKPGDPVLMSPVNDDVILFAVLAAGVRPVMAPLSGEDGNIDVEAVQEQTWARVRAVITTNLYGLPDRVTALRERCRTRGIPLIEDVAHAIETSVDGKPLGTFGDMAAFSFSKHLDAGCGGLLALGEGRLRDDMVRMRDEIATGRGAPKRAAEFLRPLARALLETVRAAGAQRGARTEGMLLRSERGSSYRMDLRAEELRHAIASGPGLDAFQPWLRVDLGCYRMLPGADARRRILARLGRLDADRDARMEAVDRIRREVNSAAPVVCRGDPQPLFRVPLLVSDRDAVRTELGRRGFWAHYIYDPPLDDYAGAEFAEPSPSPAGARWWARHVLPIDPLRAEIVFRAFRTRAPVPAAWAGTD